MRLIGDLGASMLEMLLALAIAAMALPLAHNQLSNVGENLKALAAAKEIAADAGRLGDYLMLRGNDFPTDEFVAVETDSADKTAYVGRSAEGITAFIAFKAKGRSFLALLNQ